MRSCRRSHSLPRRAACILLALVVIADRVAAQGPSQPPSLPDPLYVGGPFSVGVDRPLPVATGVEIDAPRWFAGATGLVMTRTLPAGAATMQPLDGVQLNTADASATWPGGVDLHVGRWFGARQHHGLEAIYWGVYDIGSAAATSSSGPPGISAIPQAPGATIAGLPADEWLTGAARQEVGRSDVVNDVEINWLYAPWGRSEFLPEARRFNLVWLAGFRFFQLGDTLTATTGTGDPTLGAADLTVATDNDLYGGQMGAKFDWLFTRRLRLRIVPTFTIGGNAVTNTTTLAAADGTLAEFADGSPVRVHATQGVFSWLGAVDTGIAWDVTDRWSLTLGYRVVGVGNVAQADGQWPATIDSPASLSGISTGSETIIHGGYAGFQGRW